MKLIQQKCPICDGHGIVPGGFYDSVAGEITTSTVSSEICRNCGGLGVVHVFQEEVKDAKT